MRKFSFIWMAACALLAASLVACSKEDAPEPNPDSSIQLQLTGEINQTTRVNESGFEANDKVGVYVSTSGTLNTSGNTLNNEAFTYTDGKLVAPEGKEVYWGSDDVRLSVWAYYPYVEYIEDNSAYEFSVSENQSVAANFYNSDFIFASKTNLPPQEAPVELAFDHSLSKIAITLTAGEGTTAEDLAEMEKSFYINGVVVDGTIDLSNGTATKGSTVATVTPLASADGLGYSAIVYPQSGNVSFRMEVGENVYLYSADVDFEAGYQYKYTFRINVRDPQGMTLSSATINQWEDDENPVEEELSDIITFTDPKFKVYLLQEDLCVLNEIYSLEGLLSEWTHSWNVNGKIDADNDGEISIAEAENVEIIHIWEDMGIVDMRELSYFTNLKVLEVIGNDITSLDISNNTALEWLTITSYDSFTTLDISNNPELKYLRCANQLTALNVSKNTKLGFLDCSYNEITTLDVSNNTALEVLFCVDNQLTELDVSKNTALKDLRCAENELTSLDVTYNTALLYFDCGINQLTSLDMSNNVDIQYLFCRKNQLTTLDVSKNINLRTLYCENNQLPTLDVSNNTALRYLDCNPMANAEGNNLLETIYTAEDQEIETIEKPEETEIEVKE